MKVFDLWQAPSGITEFKSKKNGGLTGSDKKLEAKSKPCLTAGNV